MEIENGFYEKEWMGWIWGFLKGMTGFIIIFGWILLTGKMIESGLLMLLLGLSIFCILKILKKDAEA